MTLFDIAWMVITLAVCLPILYLAVSYIMWRGDDEFRREARLIQRGIK